jgi:CRP-like cAMP-binding protein
MKEIVFATAVMYLGNSLYAYIFGLMASLVSNLDYAQAQFRMKVDALDRLMACCRLPPPICERINKYYDALYVETKGMEETKIIKELPSCIALDMSLFLYRDMICKVSLFQDAEIGFFRCLVTRLKPQLYPEGEYVVRKNDVGREMYFIQRGACEVLDEETGAILFELKQGGFFGEISRITSERRRASVRTATDCNILILTKQDLEDVLEDYPKEKMSLKQIGEKRQREQKAKEGKLKDKIIDLWKNGGKKSDWGRKEGEQPAPAPTVDGEKAAKKITESKWLKNAKKKATAKVTAAPESPPEISSTVTAENKEAEDKKEAASAEEERKPFVVPPQARSSFGGMLASAILEEEEFGIDDNGREEEKK